MNTWKNALIINFFLLIALIFIFRGCSSKTEPREMTSAHALMMCRESIKLVSKDPEKAEIPHVDDFGSLNESYFSWGASTRMLRLRNGFGLEVAASGSCIVDRMTRQIKSLTIDGKTII